MKETTKQRKQAIRGMQEAWGREWIIEQMYQIVASGKQGFDILMKEIGRMVAEAIMSLDREERAGPDDHPVNPEIRKWASQGGGGHRRPADQGRPSTTSRPGWRNRTAELSETESAGRLFGRPVDAGVAGLSCQK